MTYKIVKLTSRARTRTHAQSIRGPQAMNESTLYRAADVNCPNFILCQQELS